jgi:hypothetical protein
MELSCTCPYEDYGDAEWYYWEPEKFSVLKFFRSKRCVSCQELIPYGSLGLEFNRFRFPLNDIEDRIYGYDAEIPLASWYMCESCGEIFLNLTAIGYCFQLCRNIDMPGSLKQYQEISGFKNIMRRKKVRSI